MLLYFLNECENTDTPIPKKRNSSIMTVQPYLEIIAAVTYPIFRAAERNTKHIYQMPPSATDAQLKPTNSMEWLFYLRWAPRNIV